MATQSYITVDDITNVHFKQFPTAEKQAYVDESNDYYEDLCLQLGVDIESIPTIYTSAVPTGYPVPIIVKRTLAAYSTMRLAQDSIGTNDIGLSEGTDMYSSLYGIQKTMFNELKVQITPELITNSVSDRKQRSVTSGRMWRS